MTKHQKLGAGSILLTFTLSDLSLLDTSFQFIRTSISEFIDYSTRK